MTEFSEWEAVDKKFDPLREELSKIDDEINKVTNGEFYEGFAKRGFSTLSPKEVKQFMRKYPASRPVFEKALRLEWRWYKLGEKLNHYHFEPKGENKNLVQIAKLLLLPSFAEYTTHEQEAEQAAKELARLEEDRCPVCYMPLTWSATFYPTLTLSQRTHMWNYNNLKRNTCKFPGFDDKDDDYFKTNQPRKQPLITSEPKKQEQVTLDSF